MGSDPNEEIKELYKQAHREMGQGNGNGNGNGKISHAGVVTYRTLVAILMAVTAFFMSKAYDALEGLRSQVSTIGETNIKQDGQIGHNTWRIDQHDKRIDRLEIRQQ